MISEESEAVVFHDGVGKETWFNSICLLHPAGQPNDQGKSSPWNVTYGDGQSIDSNDVERAAETLKGQGVAFKWQKGDVLLLDNSLTMHGRNSYTGPRKILAAFGI